MSGITLHLFILPLVALVAITVACSRCRCSFLGASTPLLDGRQVDFPLWLGS